MNLLLCLMFTDLFWMFYVGMLPFRLGIFCNNAYCLHSNQVYGWSLELIWSLCFKDIEELKILVRPHSF